MMIMSFLVLTGCLFDNNESRNKEPQQNEDPIEQQIKSMTLEEKIGQMILVGFDGTSPSGHAVEMIRQFHVGGIILYKNNMTNAEQTMDLLNHLKETNGDQIPLFLSVDQEGGRIDRMPEEFAKLPTNQEIGEVNNEQLSFEIGQILGGELQALGFNMDYAPVLDINSNPDNPIIGDRAFGAEVEVVRDLGVQTMKGIQSQHVIPVVKHFPGHGDTSVDSHLELPVVGKSLQEIEQFELIPFADAIKNNADVVMIAHILMPQIDADNPSSHSKTMITDILRDKLKFNGVVITDDMTMEGITKNFDIGEASVKSVNAGADMIMVAHDYDKQVYVVEALKDAVKEGVITEETVNQSIHRIFELKNKYQLSNNTISSVDIEGINAKIEETLAPYF